MLVRQSFLFTKKKKKEKENKLEDVTFYVLHYIKMCCNIKLIKTKIIN